MTYIAYYRVSTTKQEASGLGLEAHRHTVQARFQTIADYTDVESGKRSDRPELAKAIEHCKRVGSTLVIAKLDRLSRDVEFIAKLMKSACEFIACDMPEADIFTIHIFAALAQREREMISQRTKSALQVLKSRGVKLGGPQTRSPQDATNHCRMMRERRKEKPVKDAVSILVGQMKGQPLATIADALNRSGHRTERDRLFTPTQVHRILKKITN